MSRARCLLLVLVVGAQAVILSPGGAGQARADDSTTTTVSPVPTVTVFQATPQIIPTVNIPQPTVVVTSTPRPSRPRHHRQHRRHRPKHHTVVTHVVQQVWIRALLTSYCPGSAGWLSSSGIAVFYGMLANDHYAFGTHIYLPVLNLLGAVEDRQADSSWNHFDVWSATCFSTPTGWYRVAVQQG